jgi:enolase
VITLKSIAAREILDSRGLPTVEVDVHLTDGSMGRAAVPSGASTGAHEAWELRDNDPKRFHGKGVRTAIANIQNTIEPALRGFSLEDQAAVDQRLLDLDGTESKKRLGANAILAVSLGVARAVANSKGHWLYEHLGQGTVVVLPVPLMNVLNGGAHANNGLDVQEFMIVPAVDGGFAENLRAGSEIFQALKKIIAAKGLSTAVGDEGGFAPQIDRNVRALELLAQAIDKAGYRIGDNVGLALDVAATELYREGRYRWEGRDISGDELLEIYRGWAAQFPIWSIEDGFAEDDWSAWINMTRALGGQMQIVGDDLFVTNVNRLREGIDRRAANAILIKVNQIGSLSETAQAIGLAQKHRFACVMSHRSGETEDPTIADLAVGFGCQQIKTGSLSRGERTAKYNQLLRIQERLAGRADYWGRRAFVQFAATR